MKYRITKSYCGSIELEYGDKIILLTDKNPTIDLTIKEYGSIPEHKKYLFLNGFLLVEHIQEAKQEAKKVNK